MTDADPHAAGAGGLARPAVAFARDFAAYAGARGGIAALWVLAAAMLENVGVVLLVPFLSVATREDPGAATAVFSALGAETHFQRLAAMLIAFVVLLGARAAAVMARLRLLARLRAGYAEHWRNRILGGLARASWTQVLRLRHARVTQIVAQDVNALAVVARLTIDAAVAVVMLASQLAIAFYLAPVFAAVSLAMIGAGAFFLRALLRRSHGHGRAQLRAHQALAQSLNEFLGGLKLAIGQNLQEGFIAEFQTAAAELRERQLAFDFQQSDNRLALSTGAGLLGAICALIGLGPMGLSTPLVFALLLIFTRLAGPAQTLVSAAQQFAHHLPAFERVRRLGAELAPAEGPALGAVAAAPTGTIRFEHVSYRHADGAGESRGGLAEVSLEIAPGAFLGVAGPSGAGKTTFLDLLVGLVAPQAGTISVGGAPLAGAVLSQWRDGLAYVTQDPFLFHDTLRRNLLWSRRDAAEEELWAALALAGAADFVRALPQGLDTIAGERGALFSGGERQRLALARALLRRPRLLALDEATSALDMASEAGILARLAALRPRPTIVLVAHRRESLKYCDRVIAFADGRRVVDLAAVDGGD
jgi:ABC-type multidrug transport system fused ATPase/permease subunit